MAIEFSKAIGLVAAITNTAKRLLHAREEVKINEVAIQLQGIVIDLQSEMMIIQADYQKVLRSCKDLENELIAREDWEKESSRYHLKKAGGASGGFVYALNHCNPKIETAHWLCPNCYQDKKKSILQGKGMSSYYCPKCAAEISTTDFPK